MLLPGWHPPLVRPRGGGPRYGAGPAPRQRSPGEIRISTFQCPIVRVEALTKLANADTLSLVQVGGYPVIVRTDDFQPGDRAVYVPVDSVVDTARPEFAFLAPKAKPDGTYRIRAMKLRGTFSMGLLVKLDPERAYPKSKDPAIGHIRLGDYAGHNAPDPVGIDFAPYLGITKYEEPEVIGRGWGGPANQGVRAQTPPGLDIPKYTDIEHLRKFGENLRPGEIVLVTEKVHGSNARYAYRSEYERTDWLRTLLGQPLIDHSRVHLGSRNEWKREQEGSAWSDALTLDMEALCEEIAPAVLMGEVYGRGVQDLWYGEEDPTFIAFDIFDPECSAYWDFSETRRVCRQFRVPVVPVLYMGPFQESTIREMAEYDSRVSRIPQISEGVVVRPFFERKDQQLGRVILKYPGQRYLLRDERAAA